jgi:ABC-type uncharacterized transport system involved in gliding motility auxiliary subunit
VIVLAIVVALNLLVGQIPGKLDLTQERIYSLSDETFKLLDGLKSEVTITQLARQGGEDTTVKEILGRYAARSRHIKLQTIDPERNPGWAKQYDTSGQGMGAGSLVVAAGKRFKTIGQYDMYNFSTTDPNSPPQLTSLSVEQRVTAALLYVTAEKNVTIYELAGHGETSLAKFDLSDPIGNENYEIKQVSLLSSASVPADADLLLVLAPRNDLSTEDEEKVRAYLGQGGRAVFLIDAVSRSGELPRLDALLKSYGVAVRDVIVIEGDTNRIAGQNPLYVIPRQESHAILTPIRSKSYEVVMVASQPVETLDLKRKGLKVEPLLTTSANSWAKADYRRMKTLEKASGDLKGPFSLAVAVTDPSSDASKKDTRLLVIGTAGFLSQTIALRVPGNADFFLNGLGWLTEKKESISLRPKNLLSMRLRIGSLQAFLLSGLVVIVLPLLVLGAGLGVWMRRRHL